jgi:hypothetical protein
MRHNAALFVSRAARVMLVGTSIGLSASAALGQTQPSVPTTPASYAPATLPGRGLAQHPFLYAGEWDYRKPEQTMFIVRDGKVQWTYSIPIRAADSTLQEWGDATLRSDGTVVFSRKTGAGIVSPDKRLLWNYDAPKGTEVHVAQPIGLDRVMIVQNGPEPKAIFFDVTTNTVLREQKLPVANPAKPHNQFRAVRYTKAGTILAAHMDWNKVAEYDSAGRVVWQVAVLSPWTALRLPNGNTLVSSNNGFVKEFSPAGDVVWQYDKTDAAKAGIALYNVQGITRLANGNTIVSNWVANGIKDPKEWPGSVQILEVTPKKEIVWALRSWDEPANLGPATTLQLLDETGESVR